MTSKKKENHQRKKRMISNENNEGKNSGIKI